MNQLTCIFQTQEEYNAFKEKANPESFYDSFIPMPPVLEGTLSPHIAPGDFINGVNRSKGTNFLTIEGVTFSDDKWDVERAKQIIKNIKAFEETGYHDWYSWNLTNWGVKWDAKDCKLKELSDFNTLVYTFDSPWGTPEHFVRQLSSLYPDATFEMVSGSIENDTHYEFTCCDGNFEETCSYGTFKEAIEDGKWGGWDEWAEMFREDEE